LYEAGSQVGSAIWSGTVTGTVTSPTTVEGTWDSTGRTAASIEARFVGTGVSGGTAKLHSIEWIATEASVALEESTQATSYAIRTIFASTLKRVLIHRHSWPTRKTARMAVFEYIDGFYNTRRRHSALGHLSPSEYEEVRLGGGAVA
jgi:transposase InsO family protein